MTTFTGVSIQEFHSEASKLFRDFALGELTAEQASSGFKCLVLLYFGHADNWTEHDIREAVILIQLASSHVIELEAREQNDPRD